MPPRRPDRSMRTAWMMLLLAYLPATTGVEMGRGKHVTALVGRKSVILDCPLDFPDGQPVPYVIEWKKQNSNTPLYIWYDGYPPHVADPYKGRVKRVDLSSKHYGMASLNMTNVTESDAGWYECVVHFLDRSPAVLGNGTWVHLDVHAPPRLVRKPPANIFVNLGDSEILACVAQGTPEPVIKWYKEDKRIQDTETVAVKNDGTELRITRISEADTGDYICVAENTEGSVHSTTKVILAGGAVITSGPANLTRMEATQAVFTCEGRALPANFTMRWLRDDIPVEQHSGLERRFHISNNGSLVIDPVAAEDSGMFTCEVSNGIGAPKRASGFLEVEYAAHVPYTPSMQYLPAGLQGVIRCHIKSNPPIQFIKWYKNKREFDPKVEPGLRLLMNGSILIDTVRPEHQGVYTCRPFNSHGSSGESGNMQVVVREPPRFVIRPKNLYQRKVHDSIEMPCTVEGSPTPKVVWRRHDNQSLPSDRAIVNEGNITIKSLKKSDFGYYECVARNSVATIVTSTQLVVEGTTPHAPYNITTNASSYAITIQWLPGYSGGDNFDQKYFVWYQQYGTANWNTYEVEPPGASRVTIYRLLPNTRYELMVSAKNDLGDGMFSDKVIVKTLDVGVTAGTAAPMKEAPGPKPNPTRDLKMEGLSHGNLLTWAAPVEVPDVPVHYYSLRYKPEEGKWKRLGPDKITDTEFLVRNLDPGIYSFRVYAHSDSSFSVSPVLEYEISDRIQQKAITAALVGGLLLLIVSIILSVCTVKICNKRKRRKQEKEYNMVACRVTEARNGLHSPVPLKNLVRRVPGLIRHASNLLYRPRLSAGLSQSLIDDLDLTPRRAKMVYSVEMEYSQPLAWIARTPDGRFVVNGDDDGGFLTPSGERRRRLRQAARPLQSGIYHVHPRRSPRTPVPAGRRVSHGFGKHQIPEHAPTSPVALSPDGRRFRASSPGPLAGQLGPFEFSDLSSVAVPGSIERTFPSTVLSSGSQPSQGATPATGTAAAMVHRRDAAPQETPRRRPDPRLPALRTIHEAAAAGASPHYENWPVEGRWRSAVAGPADTRLPRLLDPRLAFRDSGQHVHTVGHIEPPRIADIPRPRPRQRPQPVYANVPRWSAAGGDPYRPQRPLATSSPPPVAAAPPAPRRFVTRAEPQAPVPRPAAVPAVPAVPVGVGVPPVAVPPAVVPPVAVPARTTTEESPSSSLGRTDRPLAYTRDRLQAAIGRVRSQLGLLRPASAPALSRWPEDELPPHEKSSSSGLGSSSKNTSQRTHSSSGLSQQLADSQLTEPPPSPPPPPALPPSLPPTHWRPVERPGTQLPAQLPYLPPYLPPPAYLPPAQPLDISVDDHYEFDPVLTPGTESPGGAAPVLPRSRVRHVPEMEARVQAMRQEFQRYRQRRARRHRSGDEPVTETVC
ncbi:protein turtle-like [Amphibalanus amphitrite]|uniref:protein turtle-like n=1 Tax=Amphibalanus amphitrite TaxID=1232801 RepID=UPI001C90004F|nr:protein turtle-like [Amphibalanus amphitrite]